MRGTVAKRLRKQAKGIASSSAWAAELYIDHYRKLGLSDAAIERKYYRKSKADYKLWRRYPYLLGTFF